MDGIGSDTVLSIAQQIPLVVLVFVIWVVTRKAEDKRDEARTASAKEASSEWRKFFLILTEKTEKSHEVQVQAQSEALRAVGESLGLSLEKVSERLRSLDDSHKDLKREIRNGIRNDR